MTRRRLVLIWGTAGVILAALLVASCVFGSTRIAPTDALQALAGLVVPDLAIDVAGPVRRIVVDLRLPRALLAILAGAGLSVVGVMLQTTTRNDLADPFLFGLSSGAAAGAVAVITIIGDRLGVWTLPAAAFVGALVAAAAVAILAGAKRGRGPERLIVAGLAISFVFGALTNLLVFFGDQRAAHSVLFWTLGGFGLATWANLPLPAAGAALALGFALLRHRALDALLAGDDTATSLGIAVPALRRRVFLVCAAATAALVALCGVVGFVGLMVPHLGRALVGVRHRRLVVTVAIIGAVLTLASDLAARTLLAPQDLPVGIVTGLLGGAFVLALLQHSDARD